MGRVITDANLLQWEAFASSGKFGYPDHARIVFRCVSAPSVRPRFVVLEGDRADAETAVEGAPEGDLVRMLQEARDLE